MQFKIQSALKTIVVFHNVSTYDWHFIIKYLPEEFKGQFECLGENTEKYTTFLVPIKKKMVMMITAIKKRKQSHRD